MKNTKIICQFNVYNLGILPLRAGDDGADVAESCDDEAKGLEEEVYKVVVLPVDKVIASTEEEENSKSQFQCMDSICKFRSWSFRSRFGICLVFGSISWFVFESRISKFFSDNPLIGSPGF